MVRIGSEQNRLRPDGRLEQVMPADRNQRASDIGHHRLSIQWGQFAARIENDHPGSRQSDGGRQSHRAPPLHGQSAPANHRLHLFSPLDMPWRQQQNGGRYLLDQAAIAIDERFLFVRMRTPCHEQPFAIMQPETRPDRSRLCRGRHRLIELDVPRFPHHPRIRAKGDDPFDVAIGLHQTEAQPLQHRAIERPDGPPLLPGEGPRGETPVHHDRRNSTTVKLPQEIRPQLGFDKYIEDRPQPADQSRDDPGEVQRSIEMFGHTGQPLLDGFPPGFRNGRDDEPVIRMAPMQFLDQRRDRYGLAQRDGVDPDDWLIWLI